MKMSPVEVDVLLRMMDPERMTDDGGYVHPEWVRIKGVELKKRIKEWQFANTFAKQMDN